MQNNFSAEFRARFERAYEASDFESYRSLSLASGWSESRIQRIMKGQFDNSKDGPGFFAIARVCQQLKITPDYLAGIHRWKESNTPPKAPPNASLNASQFLQVFAEEHKPPTIKHLVHTYTRSGARIEAFGKLLDYCDIYDLPDHERGLIQIREVGSKSLSALRMGEANPLLLQEAFNAASDHLRQKVYDHHCRTIDRGVCIEIDSIGEAMSNHPVHVKIDYLRASMTVKDHQGQESILIFCELIPL
jgi:hypothetical protein